MSKVNKMRKHLNSRLTLAIGSVLCFVFHSQNIGHSDFGFRVEKIEVKLSQKFPPAIAYELLDQDSNSIKSSAIPESEAIQLKVGFPELGPVQLDEITFGVLEDFSKNTPISHSVSHAYGNRSTFNIEDADFSEEEKTRLRMAKLEKGLEIEDLLPQHEVSFSEKAQELIKRQQSSPEISPTKVKINPESELNSSRSVVIHQDLKDGTFVQGEIEFVRDGSLAMTDQHFIDVRRFEEGIPKEAAQVDLTSGTFSLNVKGTKGVVIGRLTNQRGGVEGEGVLSVSDLLKSKNKKLVLKKLASREAVHASSAYGKGNFDKDTAITLAGISGVETPGSHRYDINAFDSTTQLVAEAQSKSHRPTISMVNLMGGAELVMLPERMIAGLSEILAEQDIQLDLERGDSLIWGTVRFEGRAVEGATIVASQGRTSYFGGLYLPDQTRSKTSENGMFAVAVHQPGWNDIYIELSDGKSVHVNALVYPGKVTQVVADIPTETLPVTIRSFDAFSGDPVRARLEVQQLTDTADTGSEGAIIVDLPKTRTLSFIAASAEAPYESVRIAYSNFLDYLHIPMISKSWVDGLKGNVKMNDELQTGTIVGFIQGDDFIVEVPNKDTLSKTVYFDQRGGLTEKGVAGGGFVIFNLGQDIPNIVIISERSEREIGRIVRPDHDYIQVINAAFE